MRSSSTQDHRCPSLQTEILEMNCGCSLMILSWNPCAYKYKLISHWCEHWEQKNPKKKINVGLCNCCLITNMAIIKKCCVQGLLRTVKLSASLFQEQKCNSGGEFLTLYCFYLVLCIRHQHMTGPAPFHCLWKVEHNLFFFFFLSSRSDTVQQLCAHPKCAFCAVAGDVCDSMAVCVRFYTIWRRSGSILTLSGRFMSWKGEFNRPICFFIYWNSAGLILLLTCKPVGWFISLSFFLFLLSA